MVTAEETAAAASSEATIQPVFQTRAYQQELLDESLRRNLIIALDTGSGKTHIAVLRLKHEAERNPQKVSWFLAPTVALIEQQHNVIQSAVPVSVGLITGSSEPDQWKDSKLWRKLLEKNKIMVTTPQILLDALHHGYVTLSEIGLLIFDEAHHATAKHPYNVIMKHFYFSLPKRSPNDAFNAVVRPMILGLTASPIYGGDVGKAFAEIEQSLDSVIRSSRLHRDELSKFAHRPTFKHLLYPQPPYSYEEIPCSGPSLNVIALHEVIEQLKLDEDPYVISLRTQLNKLPPGDQRRRVDQKLSKVLNKADTFTHKGLRDFGRAACDICYELGPWAADWYVVSVIEQARQSAPQYNSIMTTWGDKEKQYLLKALSQIKTVPYSDDPEQIRYGITERVRILIEGLLIEEAIARSTGEPYSGIVFVTRRDSVLALAEIMKRLPEATETFKVGCLLGNSASSKRHAFLDITRQLLKEPPSSVLRDFKLGDKNLIISTSVAEEGIDIQACGSVVRFDPPPNMVAWAQSRGRARKKQSSFIIMFDDSPTASSNVEKWEEMERRMMEMYNDVSRLPSEIEDDTLDDSVVFKVESTGALLTLHSAISHLYHFCAILPAGGHGPHIPLFDLDPPDYPEGWHAGLKTSIEPYQGPWRATCVLPRALPSEVRTFTSDFHQSKRAARYNAAFITYVKLYEAGLLDDNLLPLSSVRNQDTDGQVDLLLQEVQKREGTASVTVQMDPWMVTAAEVEIWWRTELVIGDLPALYMFTPHRIPTFQPQEMPTLYIPGEGAVGVHIGSVCVAEIDPDTIERAQQYTKRMLDPIHGARLDNSRDDFACIFLPVVKGDNENRWKERREWMNGRYARAETSRHENQLRTNAKTFVDQFGYTLDLALVRSNDKFSKVLQFIGWYDANLPKDEEEELRERYEGAIEGPIPYPLIIAQAYPKRRNFLAPLESEESGLGDVYPFLLVPEYCTIDLVSLEDVKYSLLLPSFLRWLTKALTVISLRDALFSGTPIESVPFDLLTTAVTAPVTSEPDYQRLETLGDTVLKYITGIQLFADYPFWHEGYLSRRKDHAINNNKLAMDAIGKGLYKWIIRDRFVPRKWKPRYLASTETISPDTPDAQPSLITSDGPVQGENGAQPDDEPPTNQDEPMVVEDTQSFKRPRKRKTKGQKLSTKVLADVVESLIGASFEHGGFDLAVKCASVFGLGIPKWDTIPRRVEMALSRVESIDNDELPLEQLSIVETMIGYEFKHKMLLVEALTHASYQGDLDNISYERLEFLGDSALDMIVTNYLYHAPGRPNKEGTGYVPYSPGYMHLNKEALVNAHFLAYACLNTFLEQDKPIPIWNPTENRASLQNETHRIHLYQCLLHSSHTVLEDQALTFSRYQKFGDQIKKAFKTSSRYPWALLTSLQAPKFIGDLIESLLGAVFLDSNGDLDAVRQVLRTIGIYQIMERIVSKNVDVLHPVSRLAIWAARSGEQKKLKIGVVRDKSEGTISCLVEIDGELVSKATEKFRGKQSMINVRFAAADEAIRILKIIEEEEEDDVDEYREEMEENGEDGDAWGIAPDYDW
ncbi:hypothetical protein C8Q75DRAFT_764525 [Abortiporus biennis]|nr:hypothetical protein C8Q75DRAFT_764525 [Abortiporus biennis]